MKMTIDENIPTGWAEDPTRNYIQIPTSYQMFTL